MQDPIIRKTFGRRLGLMERLFVSQMREVAVQATYANWIPTDPRRVYLSIGLLSGGASQIFYRPTGSTVTTGMALIFSSYPFVEWSSDGSYALVQKGMDLRGNFGVTNVAIHEVFYIGG